MFAALRALRHREFALIWVGQTVSRVGDLIYQIVIAWWVLEVTGSATVMGTVLIVTFLPVAFATLVGGVVVDRVAKVPLMLASDIIRAIAVLGMAFLAASGHLQLWMVYALGLLFGLSDAFFGPAYFALLPTLTPAEDLPSANALTNMSYQFGRVVGPSIGGILIAAGGATGGLFANGLSFVVAAAFMLPLAFRRGAAKAAGGDVSGGVPGAVGAAAPGQAAKHWLDDFREGVATVRARPILWIRLLVGGIVAALLVGPFLVSMPFLVARRFGEDPRLYGLLWSTFPIGFILGGLWAGRHTRLRHRGVFVFGGFAVAGLMLAVLGLPVPFEVLMLAAVVNGFSLELAGLADTLLFQELVPADQLGRVASLDQLSGWLLTPLAFAIAGPATEIMGPQAVFLIGGLTAAGVSLAALSHPRVWTVD